MVLPELRVLKGSKAFLVQQVQLEVLAVLGLLDPQAPQDQLVLKAFKVWPVRLVLLALPVLPVQQVPVVLLRMRSLLQVGLLEIKQLGCSVLKEPQVQLVLPEQPA
jgi:hypothetical protein